MVDYVGIRNKVDGALALVGQMGILRRADGSEIPVKMVIVNYTPFERSGGLVSLVDRKALVSAGDLDFEPEDNEDVLVFGGVTYSIKSHVPVNPAGTNVLWELQVRR